MPKSSALRFVILLMAVIVMWSPAAAQQLTASPSSLQFCTTSPNIPQTITVSATGATLGQVGASVDNSTAFSFGIAGTNQVTVGLKASTPATGTLTISAAGFPDITVPLTLSNALGCTPTGGGGSTGVVVATPSAVTLSAGAGGFATTNVSLTAAQPTAYTTSSNASWLTATTTSGANVTPSTLTLYANAYGLANNTYTGIVSINAAGTITTINVSFTVGGGGTGTLSASPNPMTFTYVLNGSLPSFQFLNFTASTAGVTYAASSSSVGNWLLVNGTTNTSGTLGSSQTTGVIPVSVNPAGLGVNNYTGTILLSTSNGQSQTVQVNLSVVSSSANSALVVTPPSVSFNNPVGSTTQLSQQVVLSTNAPGLAYTASASSDRGWLTLGSTSGTLPAALTIFATPGSLTAGTYQGLVTIATSVTTQTVPVSLTIGSGTSALVNPSSLTFSMQNGTNLQASQQLVITGIAGFPLTLSSSASWLTVSPVSGAIPASGFAIATVTANASGLPLGSTQATITVNSSSGSQTVPVNLNVTSGPVLLSNPGAIALTYDIGDNAPPIQTFSLSSSAGSGAQFSFTAAASNSWMQLSQTSGTTPANLGIGIKTLELNGGINAGSVTITAAGAANSPLVIPVIVAVTGGITISPAALSYNATAGGSQPASQTLTLSRATSTAFTATPSTTSGGNWLSVNLTSGSTPANIVVGVNTTGLAAGTYQGTIAIKSGSLTQNVPVTLNLAGLSGEVTLSPTSLTFNYQTGAAAPDAQMIQVTASKNGVSYAATATTTSGGSWLSVSPASGTAPVNLSVSVDPSSLNPGTYNGSVKASPTGGTAKTVDVQLVVAAAPTLKATPDTLAFSYSLGDHAPAPQTVNIASTGEAQQFTATAAGGTWLSVSPASGTTPGALTVNIDPTDLGAGSYDGSITVSGSGANAAPITIPVALTVTNPAPNITQVVNAASYQGGAIAPGEIVTLFGTDIGPGNAAGLTLDSNGRVSTKIGDVIVYFGGVPAPLIYAGRQQVSAVVPYGIARGTSTAVQVDYKGFRSNAVTVSIGPSAPGIFTADASGSGPGAILNQDLSLNTAANPASKGDIIVLYATGEGQTNPPGVDGKVAAEPLPSPVLPFAVLIDNQPAEVTYAGAAPGFVSGLMQVNARIPAGVASGVVTVTLTVGSSSSQKNVTVSVR